MVRLMAVGSLLDLLLVSVVGAAPPPYFEDTFDANALAPEWVVMGSGTYFFEDGNLKFWTEQGDYSRYFESQYGPPRHAFYVSVAPSIDSWRALARVRYTTPDQSYEQVEVVAYEDNDNYVKVSLYYNNRLGNAFFACLYETTEEWVQELGPGPAPLPTGYFWLRLDRIGNVYKGYYSTESASDPNVLQDWHFVAERAASLGPTPMVGVCGWNTFANVTGELAQFDYFNVGPIPTYVLSVYTGGLGTVLVDPNMPEYIEGTRVTLTALEDYGYDFKFYKVYDPNYPGDRNYAVRDLNNPIELLMIADYEVDAEYGCSNNNDLLVLMLVGIGIAAIKLTLRSRVTV